MREKEKSKQNFKILLEKRRWMPLGPSRALVLGGGAMGTACALALLAGTRSHALRSEGVVQGCHTALILSRQRQMLEAVTEGPGGGRQMQLGPTVSLPLPPSSRLTVESYEAALEDRTAFPYYRGAASADESIGTDRCGANAPSPIPRVCCVCTPLAALTGPATGEGEVPDLACSPVRAALQKWWRRPGGATLVFSRGLSAAGHHAAEALLELKPAAAAGPLLTVCGPLLSREWATQNAAAAVAPDSSPEVPARGAPPSPFSGTSFTVALASPVPLWAEPGAYHRRLEEEVQALFPRENVSYYRLEGPGDAPAAAVLGLVNGCLPLIAFGAGLVQAAYAAAGPTSALMSYAQNAADAVTDLARAVVFGVNSGPSSAEEQQAPTTAAAALSSSSPSRSPLTRLSPGSPVLTLPAGAVAAITLAAMDHTSKEFALGRQMNFRFRKADALRAVYRGVGGPAAAVGSAMEDTVEGLYVLLTATGHSSPLFEALVDAYHTLLRSSLVGQGVVKAGYTGFRDTSAGPGSMLHQMLKVDEAMIHGTEEHLKAAAQKLVDTKPDPFPARRSLGWEGWMSPDTSTGHVPHTTIMVRATVAAARCLRFPHRTELGQHGCSITLCTSSVSSSVHREGPPFLRGGTPERERERSAFPRPLMMDSARDDLSISPRVRCTRIEKREVIAEKFLFLFLFGVSSFLYSLLIFILTPPLLRVHQLTTFSPLRRFHGTAAACVRRGSGVEAALVMGCGPRPAAAVAALLVLAICWSAFPPHAAAQRPGLVEPELEHIRCGTDDLLRRRMSSEPRPVITEFADPTLKEFSGEDRGDNDTGRAPNSTNNDVVNGGSSSTSTTTSSQEPMPDWSALTKNAAAPAWIGSGSFPLCWGKEQFKYSNVPVEDGLPPLFPPPAYSYAVLPTMRGGNDAPFQLVVGDG
eukprot:gene2302-1439_t